MTNFMLNLRKDSQGHETSGVSSRSLTAGLFLSDFQNESNHQFQLDSMKTMTQSNFSSSEKSEECDRSFSEETNKRKKVRESQITKFTGAIWNVKL